MIIDFHTHVFPPEVVARREAFCARDPWLQELYGNPRARMATVDELLASMAAVGIVLPQMLWVVDFFATLFGVPLTGMTS